MRNINKVILIGNIARTPEIRTTTGGQKMTTFVLATNRTWYDPQGHKQSQAEFHNMLAWGKIADICQRFLQKSTLVYVEGYLKTRSWENESNIRFYRTEVVIQDILVLDRGIRHSENDIDAGAEHESNDPFDFLMDEAADEEKPASEIERSFHEKLSQGNQNRADTTIGEQKRATSSQNSVSLDEPLFEEENK